jgi:ribosomal protein S18 acetylase RimI-like enzyme
VTWSIRRAAPADVPGIAALEQRAFTTDRFSARQLRYLITRAQATALIAGDAAAPLGYAVALYRRGSTSARLYTIAVAAAARGQGVATALAEALAVAARARGCTALTLEVRSDNGAAHQLYRKLGFVEAGRLPGYYEDGAEALRMRLELVNAPATSAGSAHLAPDFR